MIYGGNGMDFISLDTMFQMNHEDNSSHLPSTSPSSCAPHHHQDFHGLTSAAHINIMRRSMSFSGIDRCDEVRMDDEMSDDGAQALGEKKKRLNLEQVKALEKSFELGNKLEPDRKMQLARALGLQPRQIAIWFQNRRARWKTKQLEKDYDVLKRQFEALKADNDSLKAHNKKLQSQLLALQSRESTGGTGTALPINLNKENYEAASWSNGSENSNIDHQVNLGTTTITTSADSTALNSHPNPISTKTIFPSTSAIGQTPLTHLLQAGSLRPDLQAPRMDQTTSTTDHDDHSFCNMFNGAVEEQPAPAGFWQWPDQQPHFH